MDDEPTEVPPPPPIMVLSIPSLSSLPPWAKISKKRKVGETSTPQMQVMDLDALEFEEVVLRKAIVFKHLGDLL